VYRYFEEKNIKVALGGAMKAPKRWSRTKGRKKNTGLEKLKNLGIYPYLFGNAPRKKNFFKPRHGRSIN